MLFNKIIIYMFLCVTLNQTGNALTFLPIQQQTDENCSYSSITPNYDCSIYIETKQFCGVAHKLQDDDIWLTQNIVPQIRQDPHPQTPVRTGTRQLHRTPFIKSMSNPQQILSPDYAWDCLYDKTRFALIPISEDDQPKNIDPNKCQILEFTPDKEIVHVSFSNNSQYLVIIIKTRSEEDPNEVVIDLNKQTVPRIAYEEYAPVPHNLEKTAISADGNLIAFLTNDRTLTIINRKKSEESTFTLPQKK